MSRQIEQIKQDIAMMTEFTIIKQMILNLYGASLSQMEKNGECDALEEAHDTLDEIFTFMQSELDDNDYPIGIKSIYQSVYKNVKSEYKKFFTEYLKNEENTD